MRQTREEKITGSNIISQDIHCISKLCESQEKILNVIVRDEIRWEVAKKTLIFCIDCSMNLTATMNGCVPGSCVNLRAKCHSIRRQKKQCGQIYAEDNEASEVFQGQ